MTLVEIFMLLGMHYIADFELQTNQMAVNKSRSNRWLAIHVAVYTAPFVIFLSLPFIVVTYISHFAVDWVSSRLTTKLWQAGNRHRFFCVIGLDQLAHYICLFAGYYYLVKYPLFS